MGNDALHYSLEFYAKVRVFTNLLIGMFRGDTKHGGEIKITRN